MLDTVSAIIVIAIITFVFILAALLLAAQQQAEELSMNDFDIIFQSLDDLSKETSK